MIGQDARERIGRRVKAARLSRGMTYRDAAAAAGVAPATWLRVEHGKVVRDAQFGAVAAMLGWSASSIELLDEPRADSDRLDALERQVGELTDAVQHLVEELRSRRPDLDGRLPPAPRDRRA